MTDGNRTPYTDDRLVADMGVTPDDVREFVNQRARNPHHVGGKVIWNFNNHELNEAAIESQVDDLLYDEYVIPYQAAGVWGYMVMLLPDRIREAEILAYSESGGRYNPFPNYIRHSGEEENDELRERLTNAIETV